MEVVENAKDKMNKTISVLKRDLSGLRAGRANAQLLDRIMVDYYGTPTPINQLGNISSPEPRLLVISVWDQKALPLIEKAIQKSDLGLTPVNDGKIIRISIPPLTEDRRKEIIKTINKMSEDYKVAVRNERRHIVDGIKKSEKEKLITEDERKKYETDSQKLTDSYIKKIEDLVLLKEQDLMKI